MDFKINLFPDDSKMTQIYEYFETGNFRNEENSKLNLTARNVIKPKGLKS